MITYLTTRKGNKLQLSENILSGDTYSCKDYIKAYLGGKWDAAAKVWRVDVAKVNAILRTPGSQITVDDAPATEPKSSDGSNGWCNKCHSYCYGDCESH